jgi:carbonic anhydrase/acetyltransferase-like protein (isoleucine patch superfamily)
VRGDFAKIRIGANTMIEDNCVVHCGSPMEIGDNVLIGHSVVVHGTRIGSNTLIGNNATILDGAQIGRFCIVGAGCLVSQDMEIPDNSFVVGVPAKIRGQISPERRRGLAAGPGSYSELMKRYKEQGL